MSARIAHMKRLGLVLLLTLAAVLAACATNAAPSIPPGTPPPEAYARFQKILAECWGVAQMKDIDANNPLHIPAFDCARDPLLKLAQDYQNFPETHRVLGWGYYYKNRDEAAARAEYHTSDGSIHIEYAPDAPKAINATATTSSGLTPLCGSLPKILRTRS